MTAKSNTGFAGTITFVAVLLGAMSAGADHHLEQARPDARSIDTVDGTANADFAAIRTVDGTANAGAASIDTVDGTANADAASIDTVDGTANADAASTDTVDGTANRNSPMSDAMAIVPASTGTNDLNGSDCWQVTTAANGTTIVVHTPDNAGCADSNN